MKAGASSMEDIMADSSSSSDDRDEDLFASLGRKSRKETKRQQGVPEKPESADQRR